MTDIIPMVKMLSVVGAIPSTASCCHITVRCEPKLRGRCGLGRSSCLVASIAGSSTASSKWRTRTTIGNPFSKNLDDATTTNRRVENQYVMVVRRPKIAELRMAVDGAPGFGMCPPGWNTYWMSGCKVQPGRIGAW